MGICLDFPKPLIQGSKHVYCDVLDVPDMRLGYPKKAYAECNLVFCKISLKCIQTYTIVDLDMHRESRLEG